MRILRTMGRHVAVASTALLCCALLVAASTGNVYTDVPTSGDFHRRQGEDPETAPFQAHLSPPYDNLLDGGAYWKKDLLLYKLMKSLQRGDPLGDESCTDLGYDATGPRSMLLDQNINKNKWSYLSSPYFKSEYDYMDPSWPDALDVKESDVKRWVTSLNNNATSSASRAETARLQRKWKIKKGKGIPSLCYFKLCSFRRYR